MLKQIRLKNYRAFFDHSLPFREHTLVVGRNNAGKSTAVEALRLLSLVISRYRNSNYTSAPRWTTLPPFHIGIEPSIEGLHINFDSLFHRYGEPPARITAEFSTGETIDVYLGRDNPVKGNLFATISDSSGDLVDTKAHARALALPQVATLPQVSPLSREERPLNPDYVRTSMSSTLAPLHFRNELNLYPELFPKFQQFAQETWPGLRVRELSIAGDSLALLIQDGDFVAEVGAMGHGLQMWLQTIWFLTRSPNESTIILDEPDVYLHPDLQRRLILLIRQSYSQTIVATHSVEIMAAADPREILVIDRRRPGSRFADSQPAVQRLIDHIGGIHNIHLARLWTSQKCLFVEGEDLAILAHFHKLLFPKSRAPLDTIPNMSLGGWGGWDYALGSSLFLHDSMGSQLKTYCILDSDYHLEEEIAERRQQAGGKRVFLHIWGQKEIENYLVNPQVLSRLISKRTSSKTSPTVQEIETEVDRIADGLKPVVIDGYADSISAHNRHLAHSTVRKQTETLAAQHWQIKEKKQARVPGKEVLSQLSTWSKDRFGVSFGHMALAREFRADEVPPEVRSVLRAIESGVPFAT